MAFSAFVISILAFVLFTAGAVMYGCILLSHVDLTLQNITPLPEGGYELAPSTDNIGKVTPHITAVAIIVILSVVLPILLIKKRSAAATLAASVAVIIIALLTKDTQTSEFTFIKSTLGIRDAADTYAVYKFIPFALSAVAAAVSLLLSKLSKTKKRLMTQAFFICFINTTLRGGALRR